MNEYSNDYDASSIKAEFKLYQLILSKSYILLQQQHTMETLCEMIQLSNRKIKMQRFLLHKDEGRINPHHVLWSLLLDQNILLKGETENLYACG